MRRFVACATLALACACSSRPVGPKETREVERIVVSASAAPDAARAAWIARERAAGRPVFPGAEVDPCIARDPDDGARLCAAWITDGVGTQVQCAASLDGGRTWSAPLALPLTVCAPGGPTGAERASGPQLACGPGGVRYLVAIGDGGALLAIASDDGGRSWAPPTTIAGAEPHFFDTACVRSDPTRAGAAYVAGCAHAETEFGPGVAGPRRLRGVLASTTDGGRTWSAPHAVVEPAPGDTAEGLELVVDPRNGTLHMFWTHGAQGRALSHSASRDRGASWSAPNEVASYVALKTPVRSPIDGRTRIATTAALLGAAIDPANGRLFVVFVDGRYSAGEVQQVSLTSSIDAGSTWSDPVRISQGSGVAWQPAIAIDATGRVGIAYCDARGATDAEERTLPVSLWLDTLTLRDGRVAETDERLIDRFNLLAAPMLGERGLWTGDRGALVAIGDRFRILYARPLLGPDEPFVPGGDAERDPTEVCLR